MASCPAPTPSGCKPCAIPCRPKKSMRSYESGSVGYPILFRPKIGKLDTDTRFRSLQVELSLTQILDRPVSGRIFFEDLIRENLDLGRPKQIQLIFSRWVTKATPGSFRTRVITD